MGAAGTKEPRRVPQFTQNVFVAAFTVPQAGHAIEADKRYPRRASRRELVEPCGGFPPWCQRIFWVKRPRSLFPERPEFRHFSWDGLDSQPPGPRLHGAGLRWGLPFRLR